MKGLTHIYRTTLAGRCIFLLFLVSGVLGIMILSLSSTSYTISSAYSQHGQVKVASRQHNVIEPSGTVPKVAANNNLTHTQIITESRDTTLGTEIGHQNDWTVPSHSIIHRCR